MRIIITMLLVFSLTGCTGMLLGGDVKPAEPAREDEDARKKR